MAKIIVDKWFYVYGVPTYIDSVKGQSFKNEILKHLYTLYRVKQSTTMAYNPCGNSICERLNHLLRDLLQTFHKEQKQTWPLYLPSLVFAYNTMLQSVTGYKLYKLMFGQKAPAVCDAWLRLAKYNDQYSQSKSALVYKQHMFILAMIRWALKNIK